ncbi:MBL fold metallo-hydrolase [Paenibacillus jilunlii]|uniref:Glyoxylase, beta-lactamase superfamily II n=1 Tax=Paenibacillus jilunlii TaxID=682956 RepID=A0A1G9G7J5_9BACL|nr:MBL fold metallo-hydrolase [Paenibacillus jilunlii]KWX71359.1 metallo-beta-lactamase [Paenibacillus jilunlii]SDK96243.1 Glyoxylase, beta-lactamase superfamily II [Paenibacillus jilunlii]
MELNGILTSGLTDTWEAAEGVAGLRTLFVNVAFVGHSVTDWILVDTGLGNFAGSILRTSQEWFGKPPAAIVLTHGHFDHVGNLKELMEEWPGVPVYAHPLELPYLTGSQDYPPADPAVGGGLMATVSPLYPHRGINLGGAVHPLPEDGSVPGAKGWTWVHTPGHSPGHISLFRPADKVLISGDAVITVKQESAFAVIAQHKELHGPPAYFTTDWVEAEKSVRKLALLDPQIVLPGHGLPMAAPELSAQFAHLCKTFKELSVPSQGKFV